MLMTCFIILKKITLTTFLKNMIRQKKEIFYERKIFFNILSL